MLCQSWLAGSYGAMNRFEELTEREVLALAISLEEEDDVCTLILPKDCGRTIPLGSHV